MILEMKTNNLALNFDPVSAEGLEPSTDILRGCCSTIELCARYVTISCAGALGRT